MPLLEAFRKRQNQKSCFCKLAKRAGHMKQKNKNKLDLAQVKRHIHIFVSTFIYLYVSTYKYAQTCYLYTYANNIYIYIHQCICMVCYLLHCLCMYVYMLCKCEVCIGEVLFLYKFQAENFGATQGESSGQGEASLGSASQAVGPPQALRRVGKWEQLL